MRLHSSHSTNVSRGREVTTAFHSLAPDLELQTLTAGIQIANVNVVDATTLTATITVQNTASTGARTRLLFNPGNDPNGGAWDVWYACTSIT
jgi:hypothetical protein